MDNEDRRNAVWELHLSLKTIHQISATLKIPRTTVFNDIRRYNESGDFTDRSYVRIDTVRIRSL